MFEQEENALEGSSKGLLEQKRDELKSKRLEFKGIRQQLRAAKSRPERRELRKRRERAEQEILRLEDELRDAKHLRAQERAATETNHEAETGALPDFAIIGQRRCGTTFLYHLLTLHPHVERAASKEPHFFGVYFDEGVEWYRRFFPQPRMKDGRRTINGEATPLMANRLAPERMAQVIPEARLIALLRNPVDRAYSDYQMLVGREREPQTFEEAVGLEVNTEPQEEHSPGGEGKDPGLENGTGLNDRSGYLSRGVYVDQLQRWSEYFSRDQMLVLKSEELYESPVETLKVAQGFLGLPEWEPKAARLPKRRNPGSYERGMAPATRRKLEEYFRPHNERLYEYLGRDLGW